MESMLDATFSVAVEGTSYIFWRRTSQTKGQDNQQQPTTEITGTGDWPFKGTKAVIMGTTFSDSNVGS